ncbi:MAG: hypothetical protein WAM53_18245 [Terrimicrobiaceae bacterium]
MKCLCRVVIAFLALGLAGCQSISQPDKAPVHTPPKGSAERNAILHGTHEALAKQGLKNAVLVVPYLKVHKGWSWIRVKPQSADGTQHYEPQSGLLEEKAKHWTLREWMPAEKGTDYAKLLQGPEGKISTGSC